MIGNNDVARAVRYALVGGAAAASSVTSLPAHSQEQPAAASSEPETVVVTGSRIRRTVDEATAAPITTIDSAAIQQSGYTTAGDLLTQLPGVSGAATTGATNNGGGFGETTVELRGLDAKRTLVLLDGRRIGVVGGPGASGAIDVNQIPLNIIDHVDVLKQGAGAVYGSDAIAGVVNFVTRKNATGLELTGDWGQTTHGDGQQSQIGVIWGGSSDKVDFTIAGNYTKQKAVYASRRDYAKNALYLYSGSSGRFVTSGGSSRVPNGRVSLPTGSPYLAQYGCTNLTRNPGAPGTNAATDYSCLDSAYNYQPYNLLMTPDERGSIFTSSAFHFNDDLAAYGSFLMNKAHSGFEQAPLPFDATADDVVISAQNAYNPFGADFGGLETTNSNYRTRFVNLGDRIAKTDTISTLVNIGLKGKLPFKDWQFDLNLGYNREEQQQQVSGYVYFPGLQNEVGPSFLGTDGQYHCGSSAATEIAGCTPINFFNLDDPTTTQQLQDLSVAYNTKNTFIYKTANLDLNGTIVTLPAGDMQGAVGFSYTDQQADFIADYVALADNPPLYTNCLISEEACTGNSSGGYNSKELYAEALVPILKDLPGVKALNVDVGIRYSDYSLFGSTTKSQFKVEYKPVDDLLLRATFAQVFRTPTLIDLYAAPLNNSAVYTDQCYGSTIAQAAANPNLAKACNGAYQLDGQYAYQGTSQVTAVITSNPNLKPETGHVWTTGFVLQVPYVQNFSITADYWNYDIKNIITQLDPNYVSQQCLSTGADQFCSLIHRFQQGNNQGQIEVFSQPTVNLGELKTNGVDLEVSYKLADTPIGAWRFDMNATHTNSYESIPIIGGPVDQIAGTFDTQHGNYAKWRGLAQVGWAWQGFEAMLQAQYIGHLVIHNPAVATTADLIGVTQQDLGIGSITYVNMSVGYTFKPTNTKVQVGLQNAFDRLPSTFYQNNVLNSNTDVSTYDTLGRRFFLGFTQKF